MNWSGKEMLKGDSANNIKKALKKIAREIDCRIDELRDRCEGRRFNVFDFINEYGEYITYEQAYEFLEEYAE